MSCSTSIAATTGRTDGAQTDACRHCGSRMNHWFTPPEASDEGAVLLCARCGRVTTITPPAVRTPRFPRLSECRSAPSTTYVTASRSS